ncbi:MAG: ABC transporter substrate-binding protein [Anaerolineae bacterium]
MLRKKIFYLLAILLMLMVSPALAQEDLSGQTVNVLGVWGGTELENFRAVYEVWEEETGAKVEGEFTRDQIAVLRTRVDAGNPPDIAILPNPGLMVEYAKEGKLVDLGAFLDMERMNEDYAQAWLDTGSYEGKLYGIIFKAANKGTIWYSPKAFKEKGYEIPKTWEELIALSEKIVEEGGVPWSIATESGDASGWSLTDWIAQIVLTQSGPEIYDKWVNHEIPWTDPAIKKAFETFGQIATKEGYVLNGVDGILATNFVNGSYAIMEGEAYMYYLGDFTQGFIASQYPDAVAGEDYAFFPWPVITEEYAGGITGGCDVVVMFNDTPAARSFIKYLSEARAQEIWAAIGGFTSPNKSVSLDVYPNDIARTSAEMLTKASAFRVGAGDLMGGAVQQEFWKQSMEFVKNPEKLDEILAAIEEKAVEQYGPIEAQE